MHHQCEWRLFVVGTCTISDIIINFIKGDAWTYYIIHTISSEILITQDETMKDENALAPEIDKTNQDNKGEEQGKMGLE